MGFPGAPALLALYYLVLGVLAFFGLHRLYLVVWYVVTRRRRPLQAPALPPGPEHWPVVTVQLPLYNEMYVAPRLIEAVCALDYPPGRLEIQVLDDSTDETADLVARLVAEQRERGIDIVHLHRTDRTGFKAGALEAGLAQARGELIAVFDADFVPQPDFLRRSVPHFVVEPGLALVQGSWAHINRSYSLLTRVQAILLDGHFFIEHSARNRSGCFFNFNGTAGIWRRRAIEDAGGWQHDTLTEDLDLSYRAQLRGWRFLYLPDLAVPSELPVDINGFKNQQYRWAKGSIQTGRKLLGQVWRTRLPWRVKLEALIHLTNNFSYVLMVLLALLVFPSMLIQRETTMIWVLLVDIPLFFGATVSVLIFYLASQAAGGLDWKKQVRYLPTLMGVGLGLSMNNAIAVLSGLFQMGGTFHRTPKYRIETKGEDWLGKRYRSGKNLSVPLEVLFALYFACCTVYAIAKGMWPSVPFLVLFVYGYAYMACLSLIPAVENLRLRWSRRPGAAPIG